MTLLQRYVAKNGTQGTRLMVNALCERTLLGEGANQYNKALVSDVKTMIMELTLALEDAAQSWEM